MGEVWNAIAVDDIKKGQYVQAVLQDSGLCVVQLGPQPNDVNEPDIHLLTPSVQVDSEGTLYVAVWNSNTYSSEVWAKKKEDEQFELVLSQTMF